MGISCNFSKLSAQKPIIKPNKLKVIAVRTRNKNITNGCAMVKSTNKLAVKIITIPKKKPEHILKGKNLKIGYNPQVHTEENLKRLQHQQDIKEFDYSLIDNNKFKYDDINKVPELSVYTSMPVDTRQEFHFQQNM